MIVYATLNQLRDRLGLAADTDRDARLLGALRQATAQIDRYTARRFAPVVQTRRHDYQTPAYLGLNHDLLELLALTNGDGASLDPAQVTLFPAGDGPTAPWCWPSAPRRPSPTLTRRCRRSPCAASGAGTMPGPRPGAPVRIRCKRQSMKMTRC